jgi:CMP-N,N'-diacetyllegionaminic acid synthase
VHIYVDIDNTICLTNDIDYSHSTPKENVIKAINQLYKAGHTITYWTARGTKTGVDWRKITEKQLEEWGVKYHDLKFGKPLYDLFICDKVINIKDLDVENIERFLICMPE